MKNLKTDMIFTDSKNNCDVWRLNSCDKIKYYIYHNGEKIVVEDLEAVKDYIKNNVK